MVYVEWLLRPMSTVPGVRAIVDGHPGNRGIWRTPSDDCFQCSHCHMGSGLINYVAWTLSGWTSRCRGMLGGTGQARMGGKMFLKDLVSFFSFPYHKWCVKDSWVEWVQWWTCTTSAECKTKYLAVSPETDNWAAERGCQRRIPPFQLLNKKNLMGEQG